MSTYRKLFKTIVIVSSMLAAVSATRFKISSTLSSIFTILQNTTLLCSVVRMLDFTSACFTFFPQSINPVAHILFYRIEIKLASIVSHDKIEYEARIIPVGIYTQGCSFDPMRFLGGIAVMLIISFWKVLLIFSPGLAVPRVLVYIRR